MEEDFAVAQVLLLQILDLLVGSLQLGSKKQEWLVLELKDLYYGCNKVGHHISKLLGIHLPTL